MVGNERRRGRKREQSRKAPPEIDWSIVVDELARNRYENQLGGWLALPWRSGRSVLALLVGVMDAFETAPRMAHSGPGFQRALDQCAKWCERWDLLSPAASEVYREAADLEMEAWRLGHTLALSSLLVTACRVVRLAVSNSSGGGHAYNDQLTWLITTASLNAADLAEPIKRSRCLDAIGTLPDAANDGHDQLRQAFLRAWDQGLYALCYALPRIEGK